MKKIVLSGIQSTGNIHLGNYLGAIKNWVELQDSYNCFFGIMNLHAITVPQNPEELRKNVIDVASIYLACGLNINKTSIFIQSEIPAHAEIAWALGCLTPLGWLDRMTQFKDKALLNADFGLYSYPVLMASDILLYKPDLVPVGEDQKQHLELTRDLAGAFNRRYNVEYFKLPEPLIVKNVKRIMSLQDGAKKMSKSDESDLSRINLEDSPELILKKIKKAKTDSLSTINYDENRKEIFNLLNIFSSFADKYPQEIAIEYENFGYGKFKNDLAEIIIEKLKPIQNNIIRFKKDNGFVLNSLKEGKERAQEVANKTRNEIFEIMGLK